LSIARAAERCHVLDGQALGGQAGDDAAGDQLVVFANQYVHGGS
jgi:D-alanyl-D-alanine carboxypeptidase/D-alanyl-D-alanine-endopeptidase (penicillin-binding protein 4)